MIRFAMFFGSLLFFASACSGGDSSNPGATVTAASTEAPSVERFTVGPPITALDAKGSMSAEREGRRLSAVAATGDEVLLEAERPVPPIPGEVIGQGAASYDQQFFFWNPTSDTFREAWSNRSVRMETVFDIDGDWVLSLLYRNNPGSSWTLRLRNLSSGEIRDIDGESEARRGLEMVSNPVIDAGRVAYTRYSGEGSLRTADVMVYETATSSSSLFAHGEYTGESGLKIGSASLDGDHLSWSQQDGANAPLATIVVDLSGGKQRTIRDARLGLCQTVRGSDYLVCTGEVTLFGSNVASLPGTRAYRLSDGYILDTSGESNPGNHTWNGAFWTYAGNFVGAKSSVFNTRTGISRVLDVTNSGATPRLIDGWFTWIDWVDGADGRHNWSASTLRVMPLR